MALTLYTSLSLVTISLLNSIQLCIFRKSPLYYFLYCFRPLGYVSKRKNLNYLALWNISDAFLGTEELGHLEMIGAIVYQLTKNLTPEEIEKNGFSDYFVDHTTGVYPTSASGQSYTAASMQVKGDPITDLHEDLAAEQKARSTYDNILRFCDDPDVRDPIKFLREREIVHYQRFGETNSVN